MITIIQIRINIQKKYSIVVIKDAIVNNLISIFFRVYTRSHNLFIYLFYLVYRHLPDMRISTNSKT
jgi:hypothetical protein